MVDCNDKLDIHKYINSEMLFISNSLMNSFIQEINHQKKKI
jgi:hypothetical protein